MVLPFHPSKEQAIEAIEVGAVQVDPAEESPSDTPEPTLELGASLGFEGTAVNKMDSQSGTQVEDHAALEYGAVIEVQSPWEATFLERLLQAILQAPQMLLEIELGMGNEASGVVEDGNQVGLPSFAISKRNRRAIHDIALPAIAGKIKSVGPVILSRWRATLIEASYSEKTVKGGERGEFLLVAALAFELGEKPRPGEIGITQSQVFNLLCAVVIDTPALPLVLPPTR